jgi:hypothetical protein
MPDTVVPHHQALGIHPGAFVQPDVPSSTDIQNHCLWVDTSTGPPYQLRVWDAAAVAWRNVGAVSIGSGGTMLLSGDCVSFPNGALLCNPSPDLVTLDTPSGQHQWDDTGITLPGGHRLEVI